MNKRYWKKVKLLQLLRRHFAATVMVRGLSTHVVNKQALLPIRDNSVLPKLQSFSQLQHKSLPEAVAALPQLPVPLSQQLLHNLTSSTNTVIVRDSSAISNDVDAAMKAQRQQLLQYNELLGRFYDEKLRCKVAKTLPAHRGIKYLTQFIALTGTRHTNVLITDHNSKAFREIVKYKREDAFYRERERSFKLRILLNRFYSWLYDLNDVRAFMGKLRRMDFSNYTLRNSLLHRKNLKLSVKFNHDNLQQRNSLLRIASQRRVHVR